MQVSTHHVPVYTLLALHWFLKLFLLVVVLGNQGCFLNNSMYLLTVMTPEWPGTHFKSHFPVCYQSSQVLLKFSNQWKCHCRILFECESFWFQYYSPLFCLAHCRIKCIPKGTYFPNATLFVESCILCQIPTFYSFPDSSANCSMTGSIPCVLIDFSNFL